MRVGVLAGKERLLGWLREVWVGTAKRWRWESHHVDCLAGSRSEYRREVEKRNVKGREVEEKGQVLFPEVLM